MKACFAVVLLALASLGAQESRPAATQPEIPAPVRAYIAKAAAAKQAVIDKTMRAYNDARRDLELAKNGRVGKLPRGYTEQMQKTKDGRDEQVFKNKKAMADRIAIQERWLKDREANLDQANKMPARVTLTLPLQHPKPGDMGYADDKFRDLTFRVLQVQDDSNMLASIEDKNGYDAEGYVNPIWIRGISTKGLVDGEAINFKSHFFVVADPARYTNSMGSMKTVACIEYFNLAPWFPTIDAEVAKIIANP